MSVFSQSAFLHALGWATLNSFWQVGLLWCMFLLANYFFSFSSYKKYLFSVGAIALGFAGFCASFFWHLTQNPATIKIFPVPQGISNSIITSILTTTSVTYLILLLIPAYKLVLNWRFVQKLKSYGLQKAPLQQQLFVQKLTEFLQLKQPVQVYLSEIIRSPLTIGYVKPIILLPVAALNHLTLQQAEAVLLHEMAHIRRCDYLINFLITLVHTLLYFNPFVKYFVQVAENQREECCDEMVLQFGYEKVSYANALLQLENATQSTPDFVLAAAGKRHLLHRIEKIVGKSPTKPSLKLNHFAGFFAALLCVFALHSFFISSQRKPSETALSFNEFVNPFFLLQDNSIPATERTKTNTSQAKDCCLTKQPVQPKAAPKSPDFLQVQTTKTINKSAGNLEEDIKIVRVRNSSDFEKTTVLPVVVVTTEINLSKQQEKQVEATIAATRKVLATEEWKEVEFEIADGMTREEKAQARLEFLQEIDNIDWNNLETTLKVSYDKIDWIKVNTALEYSLRKSYLEALQDNLQAFIDELDRKKSGLNHSKKTLSDIDKKITEAKKQLTEIRQLQMKVVRL